MNNSIYLLVAAGLSLPLHAQLTVIADLGGRDTAAFYDGIARENVSRQSDGMTPSVNPESAMLPVTTPELTPGEIVPRPLRLPGTGALFIVGDDALSHAWLVKNASLLSGKRAFGLVVNVDNIERLQALRALVPDIPLSAASGRDLALRLALTHYPVLITDTGLSSEVTP